MLVEDNSRTACLVWCGDDGCSCSRAAKAFLREHIERTLVIPKSNVRKVPIKKKREKW